MFLFYQTLSNMRDYGRKNNLTRLLNDSIGLKNIFAHVSFQ